MAQSAQVCFFRKFTTGGSSIGPKFLAFAMSELGELCHAQRAKRGRARERGRGSEKERERERESERERDSERDKNRDRWRLSKHGLFGTPLCYEHYPMAIHDIRHSCLEVSN